MDLSANHTVPHRPTVLVVEDEPAMRYLVCDVLRNDGGFDVIEAGNADMALTFLEVEQGIDCVFTDVRMPGRLDGFDLTRRIRSDYPDIKVVVASGHFAPSREIPDVPFLAKPYDITTLPERLRSVIGHW